MKDLNRRGEYLSSFNDSGIGFFSVRRGRRGAEAATTTLAAASVSSWTVDRAGLVGTADLLGVFHPSELELPAPSANTLSKM